MYGWLRLLARIRPETTALRQGGRELSYAELADRVEASPPPPAARGGVRTETAAAHPGLETILLAAFEAFFATARWCDLRPAQRAAGCAWRRKALIEDAAPVALFHDAVHREPAERAAGCAGFLAGPERIEELIAEAGPTVEIPVAMDDDAVILYTSGTTGSPKGAVLTHRNVVFNTMNQLAHVDVLSTDRALCIAPLFHATGLGQVSLPTFFKGGTVVVAPRFDAQSVLADIEELGITAFCGVPTMLQLLCDHEAFPGADLGSLRYMVYGGSPIKERVALAWQRRGVALLQGYGMTEAAPGVALATPDHAAKRPLSAGPAHFFTDFRLRPRSGAEKGGRGRGRVAGARPERVPRLLAQRVSIETAASLEDGLFLSVDVVRLDAVGWVKVVGRVVKDMIISGGENIYPAEVEADINALPGVADSAGGRGARRGLGRGRRRLCHPAAPGALTEQGVREALRGRIAGCQDPAARGAGSPSRTATGR